MTKKTIAVALSLSLGLSGVAPAIPSNAAELPGDTGVVNEVSVATDTDADYQEQEAVQADNAVQAESLVVLNETNFPDEAFRKSLKETYDTDGDINTEKDVYLQYKVDGRIHKAIIKKAHFCFVFIASRYLFVLPLSGSTCISPP